MLALISGRGSLPAQVARALPKPPLVCVLEGFAPTGLDADITFRLEHLGTLLSDLGNRGVVEVCFCGGIERPALDPAALDTATLPLVPIMMKAMGAGDDAALRAVMALFEDKGFRIRAAHEIAPDVLAPAGLLSRADVSDRMAADIQRADEVLDALGALDVGQGCVVGAGQVWGIETIGGTDHMLGSLPEGVRQAAAVLVKVPKRNQDLRADLPTIGPETITAAAAAGLAGIVVNAGEVILLEPEETRRRADSSGLVLLSRARD
ncbi:MAG: UDP-2,3-diacylglucosamine diphosphatase LpxI [Pseudomonadota bacterium]